MQKTFPTNIPKYIEIESKKIAKLAAILIEKKPEARGLDLFI